jgi:hypothetical protein
VFMPTQTPNIQYITIHKQIGFKVQKPTKNAEGRTVRQYGRTVRQNLLENGFVRPLVRHFQF